MPIITAIHNPQHRPQGIQYYTLVTCTLYQTSHTVPHDHHEHVQIVQKTPIILWRILPYCKGVYHFPPPPQKEKMVQLMTKKWVMNMNTLTVNFTILANRLMKNYFGQNQLTPKVQTESKHSSEMKPALCFSLCLTWCWDMNYVYRHLICTVPMGANI